MYRFYFGTRVGIPHQGKVLAVIFMLSAGLMLIGLFSQAATAVAGLLSFGAWYYFGALELGGARAATAFWHHNTYLVAFATLLLSLAPCGRSYSVDWLLAIRRARLNGDPDPVEEGDLFALRLLAVQMAALYFFAFWDKAILQGTNTIWTAFLDGDRLEAIILFHYWGSGFEIRPYMSFIAGALSIAVCIIELVLPLLLIQRFQKWLILPGIILHVSFYVLLSLQTYSLTCILLYLAIIDANKTHAFLDALGPRALELGFGLLPRRRAPAEV